MASAGTPISENFDAKLHRVPFRKFSMEGLQGIPRVHQRFLNVIPTNNKVEQDVLFAGLPAVPEVKGDLSKSPLVDFQIGDPVGYRQRNFRFIYKYTRKAAKYDATGRVITGATRTMGESMAYTIEVVAHALLNNATTTNVGWDNKPLGSDAHLLIGTSATYDNLGTAGSYPSPAMLQEIYNYFKRVPNDQGWAIPVEIAAVITAPELGPAWRQLVSASTQVGAGTGDSTGGAGALGDTVNDNPAVPNAYGIITPDKIVESPYLTDTGMSIVIGRDHMMNMFVGEAPRTRTWGEENPEALLHEITADFVVGATDARRVMVFAGS